MIYEKPERDIDRVFIHCSATDNEAHDDIDVIRKWHLDRGWSDIGYHYYINGKGHIYKGRSLEWVPAAQRDHNTGTIAICLHGHLKFNNDQFRALKALCGIIALEHGFRVTFHGHNEVAKKACPVFNYREVLALDAHGNINRR